jgi:formate-dependent nitrite reductase membrane component NrfD
MSEDHTNRGTPGGSGVAPGKGDTVTTGVANADGQARGRGRGGGKRGRGQMMVPPAEFRSYYGRPIIKEPTWEADIPAYLFLGGLMAGSSLLGAGADLTGRPVLRKLTRLTALGALSGSFAALVHDLGMPSRFHHMLRVAKPTSPMSVGTWILTVYGPFAGLAAVSEFADALPLPRWARTTLRLSGRPAGLMAAAVAPAVASYTGVLVADTAVPSWHEAYRELPFVFVGSAAAAAGGVGLMAPLRESAPARILAVGGMALEALAGLRMETVHGVVSEPFKEGKGGRLMKIARALNIGGGWLAIAGSRNRPMSAVAGVSLVAASVCTRFGIFEAGKHSARDPKYTVIPQRARANARGSAK